MTKRLFSLLLALMMVVGILPTFPVSASGANDIYVGDGAVVSGLNDEPLEQTQPSTTGPVRQEEEEVPTQNTPMINAPDVPDPSKIICDCGEDDAALVGHSDSCALKKFAVSLCALSAMDIYNRWYAIGYLERDFIKEYLGQNFPEKLDTLQKLWNSDAIADENDAPAVDDSSSQLTGEASAQVGNVTVDAYGIPEGSSLTVTDPARKAVNAVEDAAADLGENPEQLFLYDISVQNDESDDWQPQDDSVMMVLTIPGVRLHKYAKVYVVHVDDDGNASTIEASVNEDGAIVFDTFGFSTFAGFTVDFSYGSAFYSIKGHSEIKLSKLLDELKMPLFASDVVDLTFTDESLISVARLEDEQDWLLTSLQTFQTKEYLTLTMQDGSEVVIRVTDPYGTEPWIFIGGGGYNTGSGTQADYYPYHNHVVTWYSDGDGNLDTQYQSLPANDGWSKKNTIYIGGSGNFTIGIVPHSGYDHLEKNFIQLQQIQASNNVHLKVYLTDDFNSTNVKAVHLVSATDSNMFIVSSGASLELVGTSHTYLVLDGWNDDLDAANSSITTSWGIQSDPPGDKQLINLGSGATGLTCTYVRFQDAPMSAIKITNTYNEDHDLRMKTFRLTHCIFDSDVRRNNSVNNPATGSGGAIYLLDASGGNYTWMDEFILDDCTFDGCWAAQSGGAVGIYGRVRNIEIKNCTFTGTQSKRGYGGAITMSGHAATMLVENCTFTDCTATERGGAIYTCTRMLVSSTTGTYSLLNELTIKNCTFKNSDELVAAGTKNANIGGAISLEHQGNKIEISGCTFDGTYATDGGGLSFGYTNIGTPDERHNFMSNTYFAPVEYNSTQSLRDTAGDGSEVTWRYRSTLGDVTMSDCAFTGTKASNQGGGVHFMTHNTVKSITMDHVDFDGCEAVNSGSAILLGDTLIGSLTYTNSTIENCSTIADNSGEVGGTFRTIGKSTCNASISNVTFRNNSSHCSGGGLYWNAAGVRRIWEDQPIATELDVKDCTFDGNVAGWYGGGIYCESIMRVSSCELKNNVAVMMGGGIALQVYNNTVRPFTDGQKTELILDSTTKIHHNMSKVGGGISIRANSTQAIPNDNAMGHSVEFTLGGAEVYNNYATTNGGGVWFNVESYDDSGNQQEVERFDKKIYLNYGAIHDNTAGGNGGGIYMNGGTLTDPDNTETGTLTSNGTVSISVSSAAVYSNEAGRAMTGVTVSDENVLPPVVTKTWDAEGNLSYSKGEQTEKGGNGGGIYLTGKNATCSVTVGAAVGATRTAAGGEGTAKPNIANANSDGTSGGNGGGIAIYGGARFEMDGGFIVNNMADTAGGGIAVHDHSSAWLTNGNINKNTSNMGGGVSLYQAQAPDPDSTEDKLKYGMFLDGGNVKDNKVYAKTAQGTAYGGGVCVATDSTMKINSGLISGNKAMSSDKATYQLNQEGGGVAVCQRSRMEISGGSIDGNRAYDGGGMVIRGQSAVTMNGEITYTADGGVDTYNGAIVNNIAERRGGGVYFPNYASSSMTMYDGYIYNNKCELLSGGTNSECNGGGGHVRNGSSFTLEGGRIDSNFAYNGGGILAWYAEKITIKEGVVICDNYAGRYGGAIYNDYSEVEVNGGEFARNRSAQFGGAIFNYGDSQAYGLTVTNGSFHDNSANYRGGAVCGQGTGSISLTGGTFSSNTTGGEGGAVNITGTCTFTLGDATFTTNSASTHGGGLYLEGGTIDIHGGTFTGNSAKNGDGGGATFRQTNGTFTSAHFVNNAGKYGGGLYVNNSTITFTGGTFEDNIANQGGGLYINSAVVTVSNLTVAGNKCQSDTRIDAGEILCGGGIVAISSDALCRVTIHTGTFNQNEASYGGAVWVKNAATEDAVKRPVILTVNGGDFKLNLAEADGAGIYVDGGGYAGNDILVNGVITPGNRTLLTLNGGNIQQNTASGNGGGIWVGGKGRVSLIGTSANKAIISANSAVNGGGAYITDGADLTVRNGDFRSNKASNDGAGIYVNGGAHSDSVQTTSLTLNGGTIEENIATRNGGGVWIGGKSNANINGTATSQGKINRNQAKNGGGVFVIRGANLTVHNGYITYNQAITPANLPESAKLTTAHYKSEDQLYGAGGGICVVHGSSTNLSTFNLTGDDMAIYGNEAGFIGDDVLSNAYGTKLNVKLVKDMNLAGYGLKPEGWFEDYNPGDTNYMTSTRMSGGWENPFDRYRNSLPHQRSRMHIKPEYVTGTTPIMSGASCVNQENGYVAMTLGIPAAVDDAVVIDYGIPVNINLYKNDQFINAEDFVSGSSLLGIKRPSDLKEPMVGVYVSNEQPADFTDELKIAGSQFDVENSHDGIVKFSPKVLTMDREQTFCYAVKHHDAWYYGDVTVIPATSIYYEDNFVDIKYHTQDDSKHDNLANWYAVGAEEADAVQSQNRPGIGDDPGVDVDNANGYGYDDHYNLSTGFSNGHAKYVDVKREFVTENGVTVEKLTNARATFTFTGTGFDIISYCDNQSGLVLVKVYKGSTGIVFEDDPNTPEFEDTVPVLSYMVDTNYSKKNDHLYQVPVIKVDLTKEPEYNADWTPTGRTLGYGTYTVELYIAPSFIPTEHAYNSARFYLDGIRIYNPAGINGSTSDVVHDAYEEDGEMWPVYQELRNMFITQSNLTNSPASGVVFIDGNNQPTVEEYRKWGPNNEVYLAYNESVGFNLNALNYSSQFMSSSFDEDIVDRISIGLRALKGNSEVMINCVGHAPKYIELGTTDMYFDITDLINGNVNIKNIGNNPVAITTVKVTHKSEPPAAVDLTQLMTVDLDTVYALLEMVSVEQLAEPTVTPKYPALSYNGLICYNVFFRAEDLGGLTESDLGLAVFDSYDPEGTIESARDVIYGATRIDDLYMVATNGVHAKNLGDTQYFRVFAKKADGTCVYSKMVSYSAVDYARNVLAKSNDVKLKQLVVAMLNYGAEAQKFFGYKADDLMNKDLTADDRALLAGYSADTLKGVVKADPAKVGVFASTGGFTRKSPAVSFKGAFEINYFFTPAYAADGPMKLYFWTEDTYNSVDELTEGNADRIVSVMPKDGVYSVASDEIIAKNLDKTVYIAAVYNSNLQIYCSGVLPYSIASYCQKPPAGVQDLATAAAVYGCAAKEYFLA